MTKERRLGRGLAALLGEPLEGESSVSAEPVDGHFAAPRIHDPSRSVKSKRPVADAAGEPDSSDRGRIMLLNVDEIEENPFQPRREFGESEIASLAESLKQHDMLQPVLVRRIGDRWQLISGERRLRAAVAAGWTQIPARARDADDRLVAELAIVENLQRKDLNPIEKALSFQRYLREHGCTQDELGQRLKIDRSTIANLLRLLELPDPVQNALRDGSISAGHARAILPLGESRDQVDFCRRIQGEGLSVRAVERLVQEIVQADVGADAAGGGKAPGRKKRSQNQQVANLEQELRTALGTRVEIRAKGRGRGQIVVHFTSHDEFERIRYHLLGEPDSHQYRAHAG